MDREVFKHKCIGITKDIIHYPDGSIEVINGHNAIVADYNKLVACLLKGENNVSGIQYWAIGSGEDTWGVEATKEIVSLELTNSCSVTGNIGIKLGNAEEVFVSVNAGDSTIQVLNAIASTHFEGWSVKVNETNALFTSEDAGARENNYVFTSGGTGVTGTLTVVIEGVNATEVPEATGEESGCVNEFFRKKVDPANMSFIDPNTGEATKEYTNVLEVRVEIGLEEGNGKWREFSIVGGNATDELGTGISINYRTHQVITKLPNMIIERIIRFTFK